MLKRTLRKTLRKIRAVNKQTGEMIEFDVSKKALIERRVKRRRKRIFEHYDYLNVCLCKNKIKAIDVMITLTYRELKDFETGDISKFLEKVRKYCKYHKIKLLAYFWVLEGQKRGVPHYHIWLTFDKKYFKKLPFPDKFRSWWKKGSTRIEFVRKDPKNYLAKYISKCDFLEMLSDSIFKNVKLFSSYINPKIQSPDVHYFLYRLKKLPKWLQVEVCNFLHKIIEKGDYLRYIPRRLYRSGWLLDRINTFFIIKTPYILEFEYE